MSDPSEAPDYDLQDPRRVGEVHEAGSRRLRIEITVVVRTNLRASTAAQRATHVLKEQLSTAFLNWPEVWNQATEDGEHPRLTLDSPAVGVEIKEVHAQ